MLVNYRIGYNKMVMLQPNDDGPQRGDMVRQPQPDAMISQINQTEFESSDIVIPRSSYQYPLFRNGHFIPGWNHVLFFCCRMASNVDYYIL